MRTPYSYAAAPKTAAEKDRLKALNAELLAALKGLMGDAIMDEFLEDYPVIAKAHDAIAKAEGGRLMGFQLCASR